MLENTHSTSLDILTSCNDILYCALVEQVLLQNYPNSQVRLFRHTQLKHTKYCHDSQVKPDTHITLVLSCNDNEVLTPFLDFILHCVESIL